MNESETPTLSPHETDDQPSAFEVARFFGPVLALAGLSSHLIFSLEPGTLAAFVANSMAIAGLGMCIGLGIAYAVAAMR